MIPSPPDDEVAVVTRTLRRGAVLLAMLVCLAAGVLALTPAPASAMPTPAGGRVVTAVPAVDDDPDRFDVYFFWGDGCPHCAKAHPFLEDLAEKYPAMRLRTYEVWHNESNQAKLEEMAERYKIPANGVPVILIGAESWTGFQEGVTDKEIAAVVEQCATSGCPDPQDVERSNAIEVPGFGMVDLGNKSLLTSTLLISFVDGVNPCSMWVLTVLIAISLRGGSRKQMVIVGVTFITVTAAVYALFILGLITVFTFVGFNTWIRVGVALVALFFGLISVKDYFWFKKGLSFTIPDEKKPGIYKGIRRVMARGDSIPAMVGATSVLALGVSLVEFGCTAGFPVLWTNLLQIHGASAGEMLILLLIYMLIYQADELVLFFTAVITLRATKLQEKQGRALKLIGGTLMLALAGTMIIKPELMNSVAGSLWVFGVATAVALAIIAVHHVLDRRPRPAAT